VVRRPLLTEGAAAGAVRRSFVDTSRSAALASPANREVSVRLAHLRRVVGVASIAAVVAGSLIAVQAPGAAAAVPLSISIRGKHFVNGAGHVVRLLGVNHTSAEYGCVDGFGYDDGHFTAADAAAIASWKATAVRVPLNEDCWLGINGQPTAPRARTHR